MIPMYRLSVYGKVAGSEAGFRIASGNGPTLWNSSVMQVMSVCGDSRM